MSEVPICNKAAEAKKKEKQDEIGKCKAEYKAKAEAKKKEKEEAKHQQAAKQAMGKAAKTAGKKCGRQGKKKVVKESSSEEEMEIEFQDSSEYESENDSYDTRCAECNTHFRGKELCMVIRHDNEHCDYWYHQRCTDLEVMRKTEKEIQAMLFTCNYC